MKQGNDAVQNLSRLGIFGRPCEQGPIQFDDVGRQVPDSFKVGMASTEVINRRQAAELPVIGYCLSQPLGVIRWLLDNLHNNPVRWQAGFLQ